MRPIRTAVLLIATLTVFGKSPSTVFAQSEGVETRLVIRVLANDAKLIGTKVGGAHVVVRDVRTGRVLADGVQKGGTGDTRRIIIDPRPRHQTVFNTDGAAAFTAVFKLEKPTLVEITAYAPLGNPESTVQSSKQMLIVPGRNVDGEGIILELNGFTVDWIEPEPSVTFHERDVIPVKVAVTMLCGCPTEPDGLWDANAIDVVAQMVQDGSVIDETPLEFTGDTSRYGGFLTAPTTGDYFIRVLAMDDSHGNYGRAERLVTIVR